MSYSLLKRVGEATRWRAKRVRQYLRVRYLSWRQPEVCISGVYIPIMKCMSDTVREAMFDGGYETAELNTIAGNLESDDRVIEIGTGIGLISSFVSKKIGSDRVFTFEANPLLQPYIRQVYKRNQVDPNLTFCVLGKGNGHAPFFIHHDFWSSSLGGRSSRSRKVTVLRKDLNETMERVRPSFLILDIEGGEVEVFDLISLNGVKKISVELHTHLIGEAGVERIRKRLQDEGFFIDLQCSRIIEGFKEELFLRRM